MLMYLWLMRLLLNCSVERPQRSEPTCVANPRNFESGDQVISTYTLVLRRYALSTANNCYSVGANARMSREFARLALSSLRLWVANYTNEGAISDSDSQSRRHTLRLKHDSELNVRLLHDGPF